MHNNSLPLSPQDLEDAPLLNLLGKDFSSMSPEEQRGYVENLRDVATSTPALKKLIAGNRAPKKDPEPTGQAKAAMANKYLNLGKPPTT
jgi:hypothetical protein